jgi:hypothetical protein
MPWLRRFVRLMQGLFMGFWDKAFQIAKDVGTAVGATINETANEIREIKLRLEDYDDNKLLKIANGQGFFGPDSREKGIAFSILKSRGFSVEDINAHKR